MNPGDVFDRSVYDLLVSELGAADAAEVLGGFLEDTSGKLHRLSTSAPDRGTAQREAHSIKSSSATFGFFEVSRRARELEAGALDMSDDELRRSIDELRESFLLVRRLADAILPTATQEPVR